MLKEVSLDQSDVKNYRPIPFLPLCQILEKDVFKKGSDFLPQNNLLDPKQCGFKSGPSTETALFD